MDTDLNEKQKLFCKYYVSKDFFANGVESYAEAYGLDLGNTKDYNTAKVNASKLLTNTNITTYIRELLDLSGLNDDFVDRELLFVIIQNSDLGSKVKAISEYNKLRQRITDKSKSETTSEITVKYVDGIKPL
jgi:phage terminase small subunit